MKIIHIKTVPSKINYLTIDQSNWKINKEGNKLLRVKSKKDWDDVGGKLNEGEDHYIGLLREVKEETNLTLDNCTKIGEEYNSKCKCKVYVYKANIELNPIASNEIKELEWTAFNKASKDASFRLSRNLQLCEILIMNQDKFLMVSDDEESEVESEG